MYVTLFCISLLMTFQVILVLQRYNLFSKERSMWAVFFAKVVDFSQIAPIFSNKIGFMFHYRTWNKKRQLLSNPSKPPYICRFGWLDGNANKCWNKGRNFYWSAKEIFFLCGAVNFPPWGIVIQLRPGSRGEQAEIKKYSKVERVGKRLRIKD